MTMPSEYRGFKLEHVEATQMGHELPNSRSLKQQLGFNTRRKVKGVHATDKDGYTRFFKYHKHAKQWIDDYHGGGDTQHSEEEMKIDNNSPETFLPNRLH